MFYTLKQILLAILGPHSHREHGYRLLMIWFHGIRKDENVIKLLFEGLVAIDKRALAGMYTAKLGQTFFFWCSGEPTLFFSKITIKIKCIHTILFFPPTTFLCQKWNKMTVWIQEFNWRSNSQTDLIGFNNFKFKCVKSGLRGEVETEMCT